MGIRAGKIKLSQRPQVDPRNTFDYTTPNLQVVSNPTDPYVRPLSPGSSQLVEAMKAVNQGVNGYGMIQRAEMDANTKRAKLDSIKDFNSKKEADASKGKPNSFLNAGWGYEEAYYSSYGEAQGIAFREAYLQQLKNNNYFQDSEDPAGNKKKLYDGLYEQYFSKLTANDAAMFGAGGQLEAANLQADSEFDQATFDKQKEVFMNSQMTIVKDMVGQYIDMPSENPMAFKDLINNLWETNVKPLNYVSRDEFTNLAINAISSESLQMLTEKVEKDGKLVYKYNTTDATRKAYQMLRVLQSSDSQGFNWSTVTNKEGKLKFGGYIDSLETSMVSIIDQREREDEKALKLLSEQNHATLFRNLFAGKDVSADADAAFKNGTLLASDYEDILDKNRMAHDREFQILEDNAFIVDLESGIYTGKTSLKDITNSYGEKINQQTASRLMSIWEEVHRSYGGGDITDDPDYKNNLTYVMNYLKPGEFEFNEEAKALAAEAAREFYIRAGRNKENAFAVADDIIKRYSQKANRSKTLPKPRYSSRDDTYKAFQSGEIPYATFNQEMMIWDAIDKDASLKASKESSKK